MNRIKLSDIKWLLVLLCLPFVSSCKDDLEAYEEAEITSVGAYHRYYTTEKDALTGEFRWRRRNWRSPIVSTKTKRLLLRLSRFLLPVAVLLMLNVQKCR